MSKTHRNGIYHFSFKLGGSMQAEAVATQFFDILHSPKKLAQLMTDEQYGVYDTILLFIEHQEKDYIYQTIHGLNKTFYNEDVFSIGFESPRCFTAAELQDLYVHVVIPIVSMIDVASEPTGEFGAEHEWVERIYKKHNIFVS